MKFEVKLSDKLVSWILRCAGIHIKDYTDKYLDVILEKMKLPIKVKGSYFLSENPVDVLITQFSLKPEAQLSIQVDDDQVGKNLQQFLCRYSVENNGDTLDDKEHKLVWQKIEEILKNHGLSVEKLEGGAVLSRSAIESLMQLCDETERYRKNNIHGLFAKRSVSKNDRLFVLQWLINEFEKEKDPDEQISVVIWELAIPKIANELIRLIQDRAYGDRRCILLLALAKTKDSRAAEVIVSVMNEGVLAYSAIEALGKLKTTEYVDKIRKSLHHKDGDVRRLARKTLKKLGFPVETPPPPIHLIKKKRSIPKGLEEWSQNIDGEELKPLLEKLSQCIDNGFTAKEIAEITGVVEEMAEEQTKLFCFPIVFKDQKTDLWIEIFMDDIDSPDIVIFSSPEYIQQFSKLTEELENF